MTSSSNFSIPTIQSSVSRPKRYLSSHSKPFFVHKSNIPFSSEAVVSQYTISKISVLCHGGTFDDLLTFWCVQCVSVDQRLVTWQYMLGKQLSLLHHPVVLVYIKQEIVWTRPFNYISTDPETYYYRSHIKPFSVLFPYQCVPFSSKTLKTFVPSKYSLPHGLSELGRQSISHCRSTWRLIEEE